MSKKFFRILPLFFLWMLSMPVAGEAQGLLLDTNVDQRVRLPRPIIRPRPQPSSSYKIQEISIGATITGQIAKVRMSQTFVNTGSRQMEVAFVFPLPRDGAIDQLTLLVDGKEYAAKLLSAEQARRIYESYIRRNQDPALMEWIGTGMFKTSVFPVPPGAKRVVTLRYTQICRKDHGLTDFLLPLATAKYTSHPVEKVRFQITIRSDTKIKNIYSPTHSVQISRPGDKQAVVKYTASNVTPTSDFRLFYDIGAGQVAASVLSYRPQTAEDGYFLLLVSPPIKKNGAEIARKTVVFVVDRSGSMSGKKIEQAKGALKFVLNNLREGDLFNIIAYDGQIESFKPQLQRFGQESRQEALGFVESIYAGGSTNIDGALQAALAQLKDDKQPGYVLFLTDGLPTAGETKEMQIVVNARRRNKVRARVFPFGVGYDVNSRLLDKLARECFGQSEYVRPNEDIESAVGKLYARISAPVMTDVAINWELEGLAAADGPPINRVYPRRTYDLFAGQQLVLVGRYKKHGAAKVTVTGKVGQARQSLDFPAPLIEKSTDESYAFIEKLWAMRRVGEIIDEIDLTGKNQELINELVALSMKHGILTPYTSFLADDTETRRDVAAARRRAGEALDELSKTEGKSGFGQRAFKGRLQRSAKGPAAGGGRFYSFEAGNEITVHTVKNIGGKTFYRRGGRWVDSTITAEQESKAKRIRRFSQEYFDLVSRYGRDSAKYLAIEGEVTVRLGGEAYAY